jgi:hypothetical protein
MSKNTSNINTGTDGWDWSSGAKPLTKDLFRTLKQLGVIKFTISYQGGSDEGYYSSDISEKSDILLDGEPSRSLTMAAMLKASNLMDRWASYPGGYYNGAGDGTDYGDDFEYNLEKGTVEHSEWYHAPQETKYGARKIQTED